MPLIPNQGSNLPGKLNVFRRRLQNSRIGVRAGEVVVMLIQAVSDTTGYAGELEPQTSKVVQLGEHITVASGSPVRGVAERKSCKGQCMRGNTESRCHTKAAQDTQPAS